MAYSFGSNAAIFIASTLLMSALLLSTAKADVRAVNNCPYPLTVFQRSQNTAQTQFTLASGENAWLGLPSQWIGGLVWASQTGNPAAQQCTQLEFDIADPQSPTLDYYDVSLVNAYNLAVTINPTYLANGDVSNGLECGTPTCTIPDLNTVCQLDNVFAGPDNACINTDGPGQVETPSIDLFRNACEEAYCKSNDYQLVYHCSTGSNYDAIWCP